MTAIINLLQSVQLSELCKDQKLISVQQTDSVGKVLKTLSAHNILGCPVLDDEGDGVGGIDMVDLVAYASQKLHPENLRAEKVKEFYNRSPIWGLMDISGRNAWHSIPAVKSVKKVMNQLSHPHIHRVYLTNKEGKPVGVVTQSDLIKFFINNKDKLGDRLNDKVQELWPESRQVKEITLKDKAIDAFTKIRTDKVSGLAVVNETGVLQGNISASDLKYMAHFDKNDPEKVMNLLNDTVENWLKNKPLYSKAKASLFEPVCCTRLDTLGTVLDKIHHHKVHRIYVVDDARKPQFCISLSDIIGQFHF